MATGQRRYRAEEWTTVKSWKEICGAWSPKLKNMAPITSISFFIQAFVPIKASVSHSFTIITSLISCPLLCTVSPSSPFVSCTFFGHSLFKDNPLIFSKCILSLSLSLSLALIRSNEAIPLPYRTSCFYLHVDILHDVTLSFFLFCHHVLPLWTPMFIIYFCHSYFRIHDVYRHESLSSSSKCI